MWRAVPVVFSLVSMAAAGTSATAVAFYRLNVLEGLVAEQGQHLEQNQDRLARIETKLDMLLEALRAR